MEHDRASSLVRAWASGTDDSPNGRDVLLHAIQSLVPDASEATFLVNGSESRVAAVAGHRLLLLSVDREGSDHPTATCRSIALDSGVELVVCEEFLREVEGLIVRRRWTLTPPHGDPVSFSSTFAYDEGLAAAGRTEPETPFVRAICSAIGWPLPTAQMH
jgi:hypothetical protein